MVDEVRRRIPRALNITEAVPLQVFEAIPMSKRLRVRISGNGVYWNWTLMIVPSGPGSPPLRVFFQQGHNIIYKMRNGPIKLSFDNEPLEPEQLHEFLRAFAECLTAGKVRRFSYEFLSVE